jgi:hypothetical protein
VAVKPNIGEFETAVQFSRRARFMREVAANIRAGRLTIHGETANSYEAGARRYERDVRRMADRALSGAA